MRGSKILALIGTAALAAPAEAATVIIYQDPMSMDRHTVVLDTQGPDRAFWCMLPQSIVGCVPLAVKRGR
jgi:hypothetical protein